MKPFKFKQFSIQQDKCAMKVGTDGVVLGAWTSVENDPYAILDIGAGTGVIALMLAQRSDAETIEAIEVDDNAYEQCTENFENSKWSDRLFCFHAGFDEFVAEYTIEDPEDVVQYDLIVSNPPFYTEAVSSGNDARDQARQNIALPFDELVIGVAKLLTPKGIFSTIIPFKEEANFRTLAEEQGLFPTRITRVKGTKDAEIKRSLLEFRFTKDSPNIDELILEIERNTYTQAYTNLTKDFYLKM